MSDTHTDPKSNALQAARDALASQFDTYLVVAQTEGSSEPHVSLVGTPLALLGAADLARSLIYAQSKPNEEG